MGDNIAAPVIAGLAVGIAFVVVFNLIIASLPPRVFISTVADNKKQFYFSHQDIMMTEGDDIDGCCGEIGIVTFGSDPHFGVRDSSEIDEGQ